jgi:ADP-ribose pyrophosphatase YjhB (NUDIX family)
LVQPRFTVTVAAVVSDDQGRVLLLKHVFRIGSGWGIPGGFIEKRENPEDALRRELAEEIGLELESAQLTLARTLKSLHQIEIIFRCKAKGVPTRKSLEIARYDWFAIDSLPKDISPDQRRVIERVMNMPGNAVTSRP